MKKITIIWTALLVFLLAGMLVGCSSSEEYEAVPDEPEVPGIIAPETLPAELPPDVATGVTASNVRMYYVEDGVFHHAEESPLTVVDLAQVATYHAFVEDEEILQRIAFFADAPVTEFRFLALDMDEDGQGFAVEDVLYQLDVLNVGEPFVVTWWTLSTVRVHRGISFVDAAGETHYFGIHASGYDGGLIFIPFDA